MSLKYILAHFISLPYIVLPYIQKTLHGGVDFYYEDWSYDMKFNENYAIELEKDPDRDFVILNFSDIQLKPEEAYDVPGKMSEETIRRCIEEVNPDLITLSGDNAWEGKLSYIHIINYIDSFDIPWAPVMGNHDGQNGNDVNEFWCAYLLENAKNSLFKFGPKDMGFGNYIINIVEDKKVIHSLFMMDSHSKAVDDVRGSINYGINEDGSERRGYDHFWTNQIEWYEWAIKGITNNANRLVESSIIMHIPLFEYREAAEMACKITMKDPDDMTTITSCIIKDKYKNNAFGSLKEGISSPEGKNGFFKKCVDLGSTKNVISGHDHVNDFSVEYKGIRLSYSLKCGPGCYWTPKKNGGSVLTINSEGHATFSHHYVKL